ncbi:hypothetical protein BGX23_000527 [Mortierella sp. AD031]|nr:hypothetical protein BGX23_000527 [Mortierella sp. AD031]
MSSSSNRPPTQTISANKPGPLSQSHGIRQYLTPGPFTVPVGVRYDPETHAWSSIRTSPCYGWTSDLWNHKSFFVNKNGVESAVHLLTDEKGLVIRFGVLGETHNVLQLAGVWKLDESLNKYYPSDATTPPLSTFQTFFGPKRFYHDYFFAGTRGNSSYLGGIGSYNGTDESYKVYTMDEAYGGLKMSTMYTLPLYDKTASQEDKRRIASETIHDSLVSFGGNLPSQPSFVVGLTTSEIYQFDVFGRNITAPPKMVDVELPGSYYNPILYRTPTTNSRHEYSMLEIVAIGLGCVFGLFLLVKFRRRVKKARRDREIEDNPSFNTDPPLSGSGTGSQGQTVAMRILRDQIDHTSSSNRERLVETATSASSPATGATTITYDDEIRSLQFSSHPRPNIVLSIDDSDQSHTLPQYAATACEDEIQSLEFSSHPRPNIVTTVGGAEP